MDAASADGLEGPTMVLGKHVVGRNNPSAWGTRDNREDPDDLQQELHGNSCRLAWSDNGTHLAGRWASNRAKQSFESTMRIISMWALHGTVFS